MKRWRALMTQKDWQAALEAPWNGALASEALNRGNVHPLILRDHAHLGELLSEVAGKLAPAVAAQRLDIDLQVQPGGPWTAHLEGCADWQPADVFQDAKWCEWLDQLRDLSVVPLPTDERGNLSPKAAADAAALRNLAVEVGRRLTDALLSPEARERLAAAARAGRGGPPPFVVIRVLPAAPGAAAEHLADRVLALPWELLWIEERFPVEDGTLDLAREAFVSGVRQLEPPDKPLTVVATIAAPTDAGSFHYEEEMFRLWRAVGEQGQEKRLLITDLGTVEDFVTAIEVHKPPVIHFSGHGRPGLLFFEDEAALSDAVPVDKLARRFQDQGFVPRLIYLSACHGATAGVTASREGTGQRMVDFASTSDTAPSTAATLHRAGFPQVVAYFGPVGDRQATRAAAVFYASLATGEPARQALRRARRVSAEPLGDGAQVTHLYPLGWAQLALYHRGPDHATTLPSAAGAGTSLLKEEQTREFDPLSKTGRTERVEGIQGVQRLRFGFVGRRGPRAKAIAKWSRGNRCLVVSGLGGLGKTALCAELAPLLAARLQKGGVRVLAFDGRYAKAQADPIFSLWQEVRAARDDPQWLQALAALQEKGVTVGALTGAIAELVKIEGGLLLYLDDAESLLAPIGESEIGAWTSPELRQLWDFLVGLAVPRGPVGFLVSSRYMPEGTPDEARLPLAPMSRYEIVRLFAWEPTLQRIPAEDRAWLAERVDGHPRTVEYLEALAHQREKKISPSGEPYEGGRWRKDVLEPILETVQERISSDLLLGKIWNALSLDAQEHLGCCSVLDASVPMEAIQAVATTDETTDELIEAGMLSPFQAPSGSAPWWAPHRLVSEEVRKRWAGDPKAAHRRFGEWFQERLKDEWKIELAVRAVDHLITAGEADLAWPTARLIVLRLRRAGRYREGLVWIERILEAGPTGAQRGLALAFQAQLKRLSGLTKRSTEAVLREALTLVE
ncbi:MAG TPA: CHAT domain-containing protein, partial [Thermoanaerobaculia bacterium]|nr:CHAT domain-containing protein [Thermoanaerobaculia bacterium]